MLLSILSYLLLIVAIVVSLILLHLVRQRKGSTWLTSLAVLLILLLIVSLAAFVRFVATMDDYKALATELGVDLYTWPWPSSFPVSYFATVLENGMPLSEVHAIVRGHARVVHCEPDSQGYLREVYYFYSDQDDEAMRMELEYDAEGRLSWIRGEDKNNRDISTSGCVAGRLYE